MLNRLLSNEELSRDELMAIADEIRASGNIAPEDCWIQSYKARGKGGQYQYFKLMSKSAIFPKDDGGLTKSKHLSSRVFQPTLDGVVSGGTELKHLTNPEYYFLSEAIIAITRRDLLKLVEIRTWISK